MVSIRVAIVLNIQKIYKKYGGENLQEIWGRKFTGNMGAKIYKKHGGENLGAKFQKLFLSNTLFRPFLIGRKFRHFALFSVNFLITAINIIYWLN